MLGPVGEMWVPIKGQPFSTLGSDLSRDGGLVLCGHPVGPRFLLVDIPNKTTQISQVKGILLQIIDWASGGLVVVSPDRSGEPCNPGPTTPPYPQLITTGEDSRGFGNLGLWG